MNPQQQEQFRHWRQQQQQHQFRQGQPPREESADQPPWDKSDEDALLADWASLFAWLRAENQDAVDTYERQYVAWLNGAVVASGPDEEVLREKVAQERHVHPERVVVVYMGWESWNSSACVPT